jgi:hypothetical protein
VEVEGNREEVNPPQGLEGRLEALRRLVNSPGWALFRELVEEQIRVRTDRVMLTPCKSLDECLEQEYMKGEASMARTLTEMPSVALAEMLKDLRDERENSGD